MFPSWKASVTLTKAVSVYARIRVHEGHGLIWLDLTNSHEFLSDFLGPEVEGQFEKFNLDNSTLLMVQEYKLDFNWKLVMDGATDVLHAEVFAPERRWQIPHHCENRHV